MLLNNEPALLELLQDFVRQNTMKKQSYSVTLQVELSPGEVFAHINDVSRWWTKDFEGQSRKLNDEFIICPDCGHYSKHKLLEVIPGKKVVWLVTDSMPDWVEGDKFEWTNTTMFFEICPKGDMTELKFTHEGLVPGLACYSKCVEGWDMFIKGSLYKIMAENALKSYV